MNPESLSMRRTTIRILALLALLVSAACGSGNLRLPQPRPLIIQSGARLNPEEARLKEVYRWVEAQNLNIQEDPSFWIIPTPVSTEVYPWETLQVSEAADTARIQFRRTNTDLVSVYQLYAHFHLMKDRGDEGEWIPEAAGDQGWEFERKVMARVTDAWLLGRASFGFVPSRTMDELMYAQEAGQLEPLLLTIRGYEFPQAREDWLATHPDGPEQLEVWYRETFGREIGTLD